MTPGVTQVALPSGLLSLTVEHAELPLGELCGYASRRSRKRGFVFVSKVLGKHYPVRPRLMEEVHIRLAAKLAGLPGPVVVIAMAETAIGLGQGIYEQMLTGTGRDDAVFIHTTRYRLDRPLALDFQESHSHASEHLLHEPMDPDDAQLFRNAATLVLIDDEVSTGRTLANLATAYNRLNPRLAAVHIVTITDWLGVHRSEVVKRMDVPVYFHSLLRGQFAFTENANFDPGAVADAVGKGDWKDAYLPTNFGRLGLRRRLECSSRTVESLSVEQGQRLLVLGTGEFVHGPFLLARLLEQGGSDVHIQSTTRSPLLAGNDLASVIETADNYHDDIPNYLYNVVDRDYDRIVLCYETRPLPAGHRFPDMLDAKIVYF